MITDIGMLDCSLYNPSYTVPVIDTHIKTPPKYFSRYGPDSDVSKLHHFQYSKRVPMFVMESLMLIRNLTLFFGYNVILRVHRAIFAFLRLLEISLFTHSRNLRLVSIK